MIQDLIALSYGFLIALGILSLSGLILLAVGPDKGSIISGVLIYISIILWIIALVIGGLGWVL